MSETSSHPVPTSTAAQHSGGVASTDTGSMAICCEPTVQVGCCAAEDKAGCCGAPVASGTCGCQA